MDATHSVSFLVFFLRFLNIDFDCVDVALCDPVQVAESFNDMLSTDT